MAPESVSMKRKGAVFMKKWTTAVMLLFCAIALGVGIWYFWGKDNHPAFRTQESTEETGTTGDTESADETEPSVEEEPIEEDLTESDAQEICGLPVYSQWGVMLTAEDVTQEGMTLVCTQSGGNPSGELMTGGWYELERNLDGKWQKVPLYAEVCWEDLAWMVPMEERTQWEVDWTWLYGSLAPGEYRMAKEITDFRQTGDYDTCISYAYFVIE